MLAMKRYGHMDTGMPVNRMLRFHQAVVALWADNLNREYSLIIFLNDINRSVFRIINNLLDIVGFNFWQVIAINNHNRTNGTTAQAGCGFKRKYFVFSRFTRFDPQCI